MIVAGRPAMGKTTFSMNIAEHVALNDKPVVIFSMEMPAEQLVLRMFASHGRVPLSDIRTGKIRDEDWPRVSMAVKAFSKTKLFIDDTAGQSPTEIRAKTRRLAREHGQLGVIVIDYLQLMQTGNQSDNRAAEISEISRSLKGLAKELKCPLLRYHSLIEVLSSDQISAQSCPTFVSQEQSSRMLISLYSFIVMRFMTKTHPIKAKLRSLSESKETAPSVPLDLLSLANILVLTTLHRMSMRRTSTTRYLCA